MLSIQPNFTNQAVRRVPVFKGENGIDTADEKRLESKRDFYESQKKEFEELAEQEGTPKTLKAILDVFKTISTVLFEGFAVAWGAKKGANFVKSSVISGAESSAAKGTKEVLKPIAKGFVDAGKKLFGFVDKTVSKVKTSNAFTKMSDFIQNVVQKMEAKPAGKVVLNVLRKIGSGIKAVFNFIATPFRKLANNIKGTSLSEAYDKTAKAASTTMGVGAGVASGYNEIAHPEKTKVPETEPETKKAENDTDSTVNEKDNDEVEDEEDGE